MIWPCPDKYFSVIRLKINTQIFTKPQCQYFDNNFLENLFSNESNTCESLGNQSLGVVVAVLTGVRASGLFAAICPGILKNPTPLKATKRPFLINLALNIVICAKFSCQLIDLFLVGEVEGNPLIRITLMIGDTFRTMLVDNVTRDDGLDGLCTQISLSISCLTT